MSFNRVTGRCHLFPLYTYYGTEKNINYSQTKRCVYSQNAGKIPEIKESIVA